MKLIEDRPPSTVTAPPRMAAVAEHFFRVSKDQGVRVYEFLQSEIRTCDLNAALREVENSLIASDCRHILADLSNLRKSTHCGLLLLMMFQESARRGGWDCVFCRASPEFQPFVSEYCLADSYSFSPDREQGLRLLCSS